MTGYLRSLTAAACVVALSGCAVMDSIHWKFPGPNGSDVFTVDAKQRHLIMAKDGAGIRACAEAAPDAFSAFGSSLSGSLGIGSDERKAEAAQAFAETAATIERTQTINLLRESMYRTCERWLSGAIDKDVFLTQAARDSRSMVAVLAIEQLTGVVKPASTVISGPAVRASAAKTEKLVELLDGYRKERQSSEKSESEAATALTSANIDYTAADGTTSKICSLAAAPADATAKANYDKCKSAEASAASTKAIADAARTRESAVLKEIAALSGGLAAGTDGITPLPGGLTGGISRPDSATIASVGKTIEKIALTAGIDESLMFCIGYLNKDANDPSTRQACNGIVERRANSDERLKASAFQYTLSGDEQREVDTGVSRYESFRARMASLIALTDPADWAARWKDFAQATGTSPNFCASRAACLKYFVGGYPLSQPFDRNSQAFEDAADAWAEALPPGSAPHG